MPPKKHAIVLLPALLCDSRLYESVAKAIKTPCRCLVPDLSGIASMSQMADEILKNLPRRFALVGNSMGGYLALEIVRQAPARVSHLLLAGTNADADAPEAQEKRLQAIRLAESGKLDRFVDGYVESGLHPDNVRQLGPFMTSMARAMGAQALINQQRAIMTRRSAEDVLLTLDIPAAVVCGSDDSFSSPESHAAMAMAIKDGTYHEIANCGHMVPIEAPAALAALIDDLLAR